MKISSVVQRMLRPVNLGDPHARRQWDEHVWNRLPLSEKEAYLNRGAMNLTSRENVTPEDPMDPEIRRRAMRKYFQEFKKPQWEPKAPRS